MAQQDRIDRCVLCVIDIMTVIVTLIIVLIIAGLLIFPADAGECLGSAHEVRAAHGVTAWSTWRNVDGEQCWMLGKRKEVVRSENDLRRSGQRRGRRRSVEADNARPRPSI